MTANKQRTKAKNNNNDLIHGKLNDLMAGLIKTRGVNQALTAVESGDGSF